MFWFFIWAFEKKIKEFFLALWLGVLTWKFGDKCCLIDCMLNWVMMKVKRIFYYHHYLLMSSQKLWNITMVVINMSVFLDIFGYSTIGYFKILYIKLFKTIIGCCTLGYSKLLNLLLFLVIQSYYTIHYYKLFYHRLRYNNV